MAVRTKGRKIDKDGSFAVFISGSASLPASVLKFSPCKNEKDYYKRMWRNWQTRRFQVPVGNSVWVQIPSFAPTLAKENAVNALNPWKIQGFLHVEKRDIFLQKHCCKMAILGF